jgi:LysM repeat protein
MAGIPRKIDARVALCALLAAALALAACTNRQPFREPAQHQVRSGETLGWIARGYGVNPQRLARANGLREGDRPPVGRKLWIPDGGRITHYVQRGETLSGIAKRYRVGVSTIASANRLGRFGKITPGTWLVMPSDATLPAPPPALAARPGPPPARAAREAVPRMLAKPPPLPAPADAPPTAPAPAPAAPDPTLARAQAFVDEAIEHYRSARFELALASAREAEALLVDQPDARAARTLGARAAFVAGSAHAGLGERDRAVGSFARVRALDPAFEPPPGWLSPRLEALYLESKAE